MVFCHHVGIKANLIQVEFHPFLHSDFKRDEHISVGPKNIVGPKHCAVCACWRNR